MSEEEKRATLEQLTKEIQLKEKTLTDLNSNIETRQKTLDSMNSTEKPNNQQSLLQTMKKLEEEVLARDNQIGNLYKRMEEMGKESTSKLRESKSGSLEEMAQQWESQKVKYVEEIQNLSIELKKKNRLMDEKCKAFETTIQELEGKVKTLEGTNETKTKEIEKLKKDLETVTQQKEEETKYLSEKFLSLKQDLGELIKNKEDEISRLKERVMVLNREIEELNVQKEVDFGKLRESVESLEKQLVEVRAEKEEEVKLLNERISALNKENEMLSEMNTKLRDSVKDKEGSMKKLEEDAALLKKLRDDLKIKDEDLMHRKKEVGDLLTENNQLKNSMKNLKDTYEEAGRLVDRQREQISGLINDLEKVNKEIKELKQREKDRLAEEEKKRSRKMEVNTQTLETGMEDKAAENEKLHAEKKHLAKTFEEKLQLIKEENEMEMMKLSKMLEQTEAERYDNIVALEEKERRLVELEEMNKTFEMLIQGLKKTILEVQEKMERNGKYIAEMQKKLDEKNAELDALKNQDGERDSQMIMLQNELEIKEQRIAKLEKSLLQMIDEANSFKQRFKVANEKVNVISKGQIKEYEKQIASKDTEINILKEMLKSSKGVIRTKELEIQRLKQKNNPEPVQPAQGSPVKFPRLSSENFFQKEKTKFVNAKLPETSIPDSDFNYSINELKQNLRKGLLSKDRNDKGFQDSPRDDLALNFPELVRGQVKEHDMILNKELNLSNETNMYEEKTKEKGLILPEINRKARDTHFDEPDSRIDLSQDTEGRARQRKNQTNIFDPHTLKTNEVFEISPVKVTKRKGKGKSEVESLDKVAV